MGRGLLLIVRPKATIDLAWLGWLPGGRGARAGFLLTRGAPRPARSPRLHVGLAFLE